MKQYELPSPRVMTAGHLPQEKVSLGLSDHQEEGWWTHDEQQFIFSQNAQMSNTYH